MAGRIFPATRDTAITAATAGAVTVASTTAYRTGMYGYLSAGGQPGITVRIEVISATALRVREIRDPRGGGVGTTSADLKNAAPQYGYPSVAAYNGGVIDVPEQFVYNTADAPLT